MSVSASHSVSATVGAAAAGEAVRIWLWCVAALVFAMIVVGGAVRLTDSGLSITEWQPLLGAIPPLNEADWLAAFEKYKAIPEYSIVNAGMSLEAFKAIYWWVVQLIIAIIAAVVSYALAPKAPKQPDQKIKGPTVEDGLCVNDRFGTVVVKSPHLVAWVVTKIEKIKSKGKK